MNVEPKTWLVRWFQRRIPGLEIAWETHANVAYFDVGWVDSFSAVELIEDIEKAFDLRLLEEDLGDPAFGTMAGLVVIIERRARG